MFRQRHDDAPPRTRQCSKVRIIVSFGGFCHRPVPHGRFLLELGPRSGFGRAGRFCVSGPRGVLSCIRV
jgi:hypothetical protein